MLCKSLLRAEMIEHEDTQETLAKALGLSASRLNAKINERGKACFNSREINLIRERYSLADERAMAIFFADEVS